MREFGNEGWDYGFQLNLSINGFKSGFGDYSFHYILILPNGDEFIDGWGFPELQKGWTYIYFNNGWCFYNIYSTYKEIPVGQYKLISTINGYIVGEKEFKVEP